MFSKSEIVKIVEKNAAELGIEPDDLGKFGELIAATIYEVVKSDEFTRQVVDDTAKRQRRIIRGYGG